MLCARTQAKVVTHTYYGCNNAGEGSGDVSIGKCGGHAPIGKLAPDGFRDSARSVCVCVIQMHVCLCRQFPVPHPCRKPRKAISDS